MLKLFRIAFGASGDKTAVPDDVVVAGDVSYTQGYGPDYSRINTDPLHKNIERDKWNQILYSITYELGLLQMQAFPDWITTALNGGSPFQYSVDNIVRYSGTLWVSIANSNTATPGTDVTKWLPVDLSVRYDLQTNFGAPIFTQNYYAKTFPTAAIADNAKFSFHVNKLINVTDFVGFVDSSTQDYTSQTGSINSAAFLDQSTSVGSKDIGTRRSYVADQRVGIGASTTIGELTSFFSQTIVNAGLITDFAHFRAKNPAGSGGTIATIYGVFVENQTRATNNWGLFVDSVRSFFGGLINFGTGVTPSGATVGHNSATNTLMLTPSSGGAVKIAGPTGERKLRFGIVANNTDDVIVEQVASGDLEVTCPTISAVARRVKFNSPVIFAGNFIQGSIVTFAALPAASTVPGARAIISDGNTTLFNNSIAGGSTNIVPVFSNGTDWRCG